MYVYSKDGMLYHHDIKGQKWGKRRFQNQDGSLTPAGEQRYLSRSEKKAAKLEKKVTDKYSKAGQLRGRADYFKKLGDDASKKYDDDAKALDKQAKEWDKKGSYIKAQLARKGSALLKDKGQKAREEYDEEAESIMREASRLEIKASKYATKKRVDLGKKIDSILKEAKKKGYDKESKYEHEGWDVDVWAGEKQKISSVVDRLKGPRDE